jgi:hypothetical protein
MPKSILHAERFAIRLARHKTKPLSKNNLTGDISGTA